MYYTGIGSRETPDDVLELMSKLSKFWAEKGWILRSGHADGADMAFESAAYYAEGKAEIFLPWKTFNNDEIYYSPRLEEPEEWTYEIAAHYHPAWNYIKWGAQKLHARNVHQVLGLAPLSPSSDFVCCWTKDGKSGGGTGQAIRIAKGYNIPVYDLGNSNIRNGFEYGIKRYQVGGWFI